MKGFTFLELVIAMSILTIGVVGLMGGLNIGFQTNSSMEYKVLQMKAVQEMTEQLKTIDFADLPAQNNLAFQVLEIPEVPGNIGLVQVTDASGGAGNVYEITVTVAIPNGHGLPPISTKLVSRRSR